MGKSPRQRGQRSISKTSTERKNLPSESGDYEAPTVGYKNVRYLYGTIKANTLFGTVDTKLAGYVSVQSWSGVTIVWKAMEKLARPMLTKTTLPSPTKE